MRRPDTLTSDESGRDAWTDSASRTGVPSGVPPALSVKGAAAALDGMDHRLLLDWVRTPGLVPEAFQPAGPGGKYWIPAEAVRRLAVKLLIEPDWDAAIEEDR